MVNTKIKLIIFFEANEGELYTVSQKSPGTDCGSYHECLIAKFRLKWKKLGKITRPLRYDLKKVKVLATQ